MALLWVARDWRGGPLTLARTSRLVLRELPRLTADLDVRMLDGARRDDFESMSALCDQYNAAIERMHAAGVSLSAGSDLVDHDMCRHIMTQVYNRGVRNVRQLNSYAAFTSEVYGEFNIDMITHMLEKVPVTDHDTFLDMGSGVGHVVLQVAALKRCKLSVGVEKRDLPAEYAENLARDFTRRMRWWGKRHGEFLLIHDDFLNPALSDRIMSSTVIFANNYAFRPELNQRIKAIFFDLPNGTRIVSSLPYRPITHRINLHNVGDFSSMLRVRRYRYNAEGVSWTGASFDYYVQTVDHSLIGDVLDGRGGGDLGIDYVEDDLKVAAVSKAPQPAALPSAPCRKPRRPRLNVIRGSAGRSVRHVNRRMSAASHAARSGSSSLAQTARFDKADAIAATADGGGGDDDDVDGNNDDAKDAASTTSAVAAYDAGEHNSSSSSGNGQTDKCKPPKVNKLDDDHEGTDNVCDERDDENNTVDNDRDDATVSGDSDSRHSDNSDTAEWLPSALRSASAASHGVPSSRARGRRPAKRTRLNELVESAQTRGADAPTRGTAVQHGPRGAAQSARGRRRGRGAAQSTVGASESAHVTRPPTTSATAATAQKRTHGNRDGAEDGGTEGSLVPSASAGTAGRARGRAKQLKLETIYMDGLFVRFVDRSARRADRPVPA